jgi:putative peptide zinc metalloprotease protein
MAETPGKLRSDLEIQQEKSSGVIVKDPITHRFYRFSAVQASVLELLNGQQDYDSIAADVSRKHQVEALTGQILEFTAKLRALLLLDHPYCWAQLRNIDKNRQGTIRNLLHIKIRAFNPDRLLTLLEKKLRFFFSVPFQYLFGLLAFIALILSMLHWKSLFVSVADLFSLYSLPLILIVVIAVMTIHEFAHGITLKHYGGKTEEMGVMFLYFIPALYCNVSDAWMLKKRERILVALAGGYIQLFLWAAATVCWRLLAPETLASRICLISIMFNGVLSFFNFNPLIRLDGYYMLSDYIEVPNLRSKALSYLKHTWHARLIGTEPVRKEGQSRREKRILLLYGAASCLFTAGLILYMTRLIGGWMVQEYRTWGVIMASMLFAMAVPVVIKVNVSGSGKFLKAIFVRIRKSPKLSIALLFIVLGAFFPWELKITGDFTIVPQQYVAVTPLVEGNIIKIYVDEGSRVSAGSLLAGIENLELTDSYHETKEELASQRYSLDLLKAGARPEAINEAMKLVETKKAEYENSSMIDEERSVLSDTIAKEKAALENARLINERNQKLRAEGLISLNEADSYRTTYEVQEQEFQKALRQLNVFEEQKKRIRDIKKKELAQAESSLRLLQAGPRTESVQEAESQVKKLEENLKILEKKLEYLEIRSPIGGIVETSHLRDRIGAFLEKSDIFCKIVSEGTVRIEMPIPEKEIDDIKEGFPITMKVRGYPRKWFEAHVQSIAPVTAAKGSERTVVVYGELENRDGSLKSGMTGVGKILCGKRLIIEIASRRATRWLRTEFWEYLP